jgi:E3 SUMO-protein ligase PIAS1
MALPEHHAASLRLNSSIRIMLYCGENSHSNRSSATDISFPLNIEIKINDQEIRTNTKGIKGKPGSTRPVDITAFLRRQHGASNNISVTYALTAKVR